VSATIIQLGTDLSGKKSTSDFVEISEHIQNGAKHLKDLGIDDIISLLDEYAKALQKSNVRSMEGVPFLFMWLRKSNLEKMITQSFPDPTILTGFVGERRKKIKAQPRGVVCHWIAGNVPTLGLFSLFQSMLVGNANILRVPKESIDMIKQLLKIMADSKAADLMDSFSVVTFPSSDKTLNSNLSMAADARIVWGGKEAVEAITGLPRQSHCEDIVFGPKYSFAVMDDEALKSSELSMILQRLVNDIIVFDQSACSSPQVLFFEKGTDPEKLMEQIATEFQTASKRSPKISIDTSIATKIISKRAEYALSPEKNLKNSPGNDWTLLYDQEINLEEPVQSRTLFVKPVDSVLDTVPLITNKIQTIGCEIHDEQKLLEYADAVTAKGVARCVPFGQMNFYDVPWDGMFVLSRLVRWCALTKKE